ncbi:hypothetical protein B0H19DRAFT_1174819 [Mycena capillaripes]|nr:hypothetical protein B0H19DRAFT_1174819 [Mycena capillaripes]
MAETLSTALLLAHSAATGVKERAQELILESRANIIRFESQIKQLERLRAREYNIIAALQLITAPVRTLPSALLGRIFIHALYAGNHRDGWADASIKDILVLAQVCSHWRQAALNTPQLWIRLLPVFHEKRPGEPLLAATKIFLERSAPLPFPVSLGSGYDASAGANLVPLMDTLFAVPHRWFSLTLSTKLLATLAQLPAGALTALETLDLRSTSPVGREQSELHPNVNVFLQAPRLRRVTLWHVKNTEMPWSQLTTLALAEESPRACLDVIVRCSNLVSATLRMSGWPESVFFVETDTVTLEYLKSLEIHISNTSSDEHFTPFLQRLNLPSLTALKMYGEYHSGVITWSTLAFTLFQIRSPLIEHLQIDHCALTSEDLQAVVHHAPSMTHLEIYNCSNCIDDGFLAGLRYAPFDPAPLAPKLEVLWLSSLRCDFDESSLRDMVESRWWTEEELLAMPSPPAVARLKNVQYTSSRKFSKKFDKRMQVYRAEGLEFSTLVS